jgi:hypothetical protein
MRAHRLLGLTVAVAALWWHSPAVADLKEGDQALLFTSVDENLDPVDMRDMTEGRPLVLVVGSCS